MEDLTLPVREREEVLSLAPGKPTPNLEISFNQRKEMESTAIKGSEKVQSTTKAKLQLPSATQKTPD